MKFNSFEDLFNFLLSDAYIIEQNSLKLMPKLIQKAYSDELKQALQKHFGETKEHARRMEKIFSKLNPKLQKSEWVHPFNLFFKSAEETILQNEPSFVLDAGIIAIMQQIEHLEIAIYGTLREYASQIDQTELKNLLNETLKEESKTDTILNKLAEGGFLTSGLNEKAIKQW